MEEFEDMPAVMRKQSGDTRSEAMQVTNMLLKMQSFQDDFKNYPEGKEYSVEKALEFYNLFFPFSVVINEMAKKVNELRELFDNEFQVRGIDISKK